MVAIWRLIAGIIFLVCICVAAAGVWHNHLNREIRTTRGIRVFPTRYNPDLKFLDDKYFETCKCLGGCRMNFTVEIVTNDICFPCGEEASSTGFCQGLTGFRGEMAYVFLTENLHSAAWEFVRTQHRDTAPDLLYKCGRQIDNRMNKEYQRQHGDWPMHCEARGNNGGPGNY